MASIKVQKCSDSTDWCWSLLDEEDGVVCDGYASTRTLALQAARKALEEINRLNEAD